ncbi:unnamed protein product [Schistocephalus solidus]|uniref:Integrase n=1 Tax=Schistocephalus solidus TaxID=70667 RepID=A0A183T6T1_SCHSO|nr:unnamed protein product [Schistocephalus solidus]
MPRVTPVKKNADLYLRPYNSARLYRRISWTPADEFATELKQLARRSFPNLPPTDRDDLVLKRFISGLRNRAVSNHFTLSPLANLATALPLCRRYDNRQIQDPTPNPCKPA